MCREATVCNPKRPELEEQILVFFDSGSQRSYVDQDLAKRLQLPVEKTRELLISTFGATKPRKVPTSTVDINIKMKEGEEKMLRLQTMGHMTQKLQIAHVERTKLDMQTADQAPRTWKKPEILIGADYFFDFLKEVKKLKTGLYLVDTKVGPILTGQSRIRNERGLETSTYLNQDVNQFWDLDLIGITDANAESEDKCADKLFNETITKESSGRYRVQWPWRANDEDLSPTFGLCMGRLRSLLKRLGESPHLLEEYSEVFKNQLEMGIIEEAPQEFQGRVHYLPHQAVWTPHKASTKLRVVFDASAKGKKGGSALMRQCTEEGSCSHNCARSY